MKTSIPLENTPAGHMPGLDGLRGMAILAVMFHHFLPPNYPTGIPSGFAGFVIKVVYRLFDVGWWGVDLFFVLSGFLITGILLSAKNSEHYFRNFYARRSLRIFPLYYGLLIALFVVLPMLAAQPFAYDWIRGHLSDYLILSKDLSPLQGWLWLYGVNIKTALVSNGWIFGTLTHFWTLAVEEHFYLVWPLIVFFSNPKTLVRICLATAVGSIILRACFFFGGLAPAYIYILTPCRLDGLALGSLVAVVFQMPVREKLITLCMKGSRYLIPTAILAILTLNRFGPLMVIAGHALLACTFAAALPVAASIGTGNNPAARTRWLSHPALRTFGKYSYGIYVLHPFVIKPVGTFVTAAWMKSFTGGNYAIEGIARISLGITGAIALAYVSWHLFEKHFFKLKCFFPTGRSLRAPNANSSMNQELNPQPNAS